LSVAGALNAGSEARASLDMVICSGQVFPYTGIGGFAAICCS